MEIKEAIHILLEMLPLQGDANRRIALHKGIEAIEKQIPVKAEVIPQDDEGIYMEYICPKCERHLTNGCSKPFKKPLYCKCGQLIDWRE